MKNLSICWILAIFFLVSCKKSQLSELSLPYFPPLNSNQWETVAPTALGWSLSGLDSLRKFLQQRRTKAFIILKNGRIAVEWYFDRFTADSVWYWASAGKTLTALLVGIAQQEGLLKITDRTAEYLGRGWTSLPPEKENLITIRHQLTMTTGLDEDVPDSDCTLKSCLVYKADAGTRWAYHNAPYTLLEQVVETAARTEYNNFFRRAVGNRIGMNGRWVNIGFNNVFFSDARSMARFGLLLLHRGKWDGTALLKDQNYFNEMVSSSQNFNPAYGYLTWLNGKNAYMLPGIKTTFSGPIMPNAPADLFAALGKNDQKIYVVPSEQLVIIRMGEMAGGVRAALSGFDNELWGYLRRAMKM